MSRPSAVHRRNRLVALLGVLAVLFGVAVDVAVSAGPASAHAVLVSSSPTDGGEVQRAPRTVALTFDESVQLVPGTVRVLSTTGVRVDTGRARLTSSGTGIVIPLRADVPRGSYLVTWRVVSADTHIVSGSIAFGVGERVQGGNAGGSGGAAPPTSLDVVAQAAQGVGYLGVVLAFGVGAVGVLIWRSSLRSPRSRRLRIVGVAAIAAGALTELLLQGPRATASGWAGVIRFDDIGQTLASTYGVALVVRLAVVLLAAPLTVGRLTPPRHARPAAHVAGLAIPLVAALGVLVTFALAGHAAVGSDAWLAIIAAVLHLSGMAVWLGGLATLLIVVLPRLRRAPRIAMGGLRRWSTTAFIAVATLIVSGEYQAWREIRPLPALWNTSYGVVLLVKLGLVLVALVAALVPQRMLLRAGKTSWRVLRRAVVIESCATIAVVAMTTVLVSLPPASATYGPPVTLIAPLGSGAGRLDVSLSTTRHGPEQMTVRAVSTSGATISLQSVSATLSSSANDVAALDVPMRRGADGVWRSDGMTVPLSGRWTVTFDISVDQATGYATQTEYTAW